MVEHQKVKLADLENEQGTQQFVCGFALVGLLGVSKGQIERVEFSWFGGQAPLGIRRDVAIRADTGGLRIGVVVVPKRRCAAEMTNFVLRDYAAIKLVGGIGRLGRRQTTNETSA